MWQETDVFGSLFVDIIMENKISGLKEKKIWISIFLLYSLNNNMVKRLWLPVGCKKKLLL